MDKFRQNLEKALIPFREEYRQKCQNRSVIGGFDRYVLENLRNAATCRPAKATVKDMLDDIINKASSYSSLLPRRRGELLKEIHPLIKSLIDGGSGEPPSREKFETKKVKESISERIAGQREKMFRVRPEDPVTELSGVGPRFAQLLHRMNIRTAEDLLFFLPRDYQDRRKIRSLNQVEPGEFQVVKGVLGNFAVRHLRKGMKIIKAPLYDDYGSISLVWFNQPYITRNLEPGKLYIASGRLEYKYGDLQMNSPEMEDGDDMIVQGGILPVYPLTEGVSQKFVRRLIQSTIKRYRDSIIDVFDSRFLKRLDMPNLVQVLDDIHSPREFGQWERALLRLRFEEAFFLQLIVARYRRSFKNRPKNRDYAYDSHLLKEFERMLPFRLTEAQKRVIGEVSGDLNDSKPMNRMIQGDVGSGKTVVCAFFAMLSARSRVQTAVLAPTEVLAEQHFYTFKKILEPYGINPELLLGATPPAEKDEIKEKLESGETQVVVGTHALLQEDVRFRNLGFAVVDEQHKFGVMQRAALKEKGEGTDFLFTTATPIPRSLCLTLYGDLDISIIDEMPPGRTPVKTMLLSNEEKDRVYGFIGEEVAGGGQVYVVCPLIEESEKIDARPLMLEYDEIMKKLPGIKGGLLHGRMKSREKEEVMGKFSSGELNVLVTTTVIEVGVDVPNANVMVVLDAHRYGLSQLHQLRGRVGRGGRKSFCILVAEHNSGDAGRRLGVLMKTQSGFDVAEEDLKIRGPGDFIGVRQSGLPDLMYLDIVRDYKVVLRAREEAFALEKEDPNFSKKEHEKIKEKLHRKYKKIWDIIH